MSTTEEASTGQCRALIDDGSRCSRPAQEDGFCFQHDESDPTIDEQERNDADQEAGDDGDSTEERADADQPSEESAEQSGGQTDRSSEESAEQSGGQTDQPSEDQSRERSGDGPDDEATVSGKDPGESEPSILDVRRTVEGTATGLIGNPLDSVTEVTATDDGWRAIVEVVERSSVPDTQDILGQYEIELSEDVEVRGYRRIDRYRRSDTDK